jgi:hypothetical protein
MEFLLLWVDNLDDGVHALRHLAPKIFGLLLAISLFVLTGIALVLSPHVGLAAIGLVMSATLIEAKRRRAQEIAHREQG